ncbi:Crp/Fnr family transcriptional regulator [Mycobacterium sp. 1245852.3]|uniref:Crp/Fnr family transcriptional regulator n=1 Tax=Mycobacterium sp. 1245852.3 TaxID=1856860 RepID=UPI0007FC6BC7|nr:Crp/Fnr family transcriptional regulator [Mycobacterium sp. 1245852.3]OBJ81377.1 Crp/Fnr family transcriptional regulator [Mycobacterium sp. 1245852.3]
MQDVLARAGILQGVAPDAVAALVGEFEQVSFPPRHTVFTEGEPGADLYTMLGGKVKIRRRATDGRETLIAVLGLTDMFGELRRPVRPGARTSTVTTLTEVQAAWMDRRALRAWIVAYPDVAQQLLRVLARRLRRTNDTLCNLIFTDVPGRVAKQLLDLASRFGTNTGQTLRVDLNLTQEELAQLVGSSRETVNKVLSDFTQRGWIRQQRGRLSILAPHQLARHSR